MRTELRQLHGTALIVWVSTRATNEAEELGLRGIDTAVFAEESARGVVDCKFEEIIVCRCIESVGVVEVQAIEVAVKGRQHARIAAQSGGGCGSR